MHIWRSEFRGIGLDMVDGMYEGSKVHCEKGACSICIECILEMVKIQRVCRGTSQFRSFHR
jgi:hypothetical protein